MSDSSPPRWFSIFSAVVLVVVLAAFYVGFRLDGIGGAIVVVCAVCVPFVGIYLLWTMVRGLSGALASRKDGRDL